MLQECECAKLLDRHAFRKIARLVDVGAFGNRRMIGQKLQRQNIDQRRHDGVGFRHRDVPERFHADMRDAFLIRHDDDLAAARHDFLNVRNRFFVQRGRRRR